MGSTDESLKTTEGDPDPPRTTAASGAPLEATRVWRNPTGAASSSVHRVDDLDLVVTSPSGRKYYGNDGMDSGLWSTPDGGNADSINAVENVFAEVPEAGTWELIVAGVEVNTDAIPQSSEVDTWFALVVSGVANSSPVRAADWNGDGVLDVADLSAYLADHARGRGDVDGNGRTAPADVAAFVRRLLPQLTGE